MEAIIIARKKRTTLNAKLQPPLPSGQAPTGGLFSATRLLRRSARPVRAEIPRAIKVLTAGIVKRPAEQIAGDARSPVRPGVPSTRLRGRAFHRILIR